MIMAHMEVFQNHYNTLIRCLPMDDDLFLGQLLRHDLLPGDTDGKVKSLLTPIERATCFLNRVIKPSLNVNSMSFDKLLLVMSESDYPYVKELSCNIKSDIAKWGESTTYGTGML